MRQTKSAVMERPIAIPERSQSPVQLLADPMLAPVVPQPFDHATYRASVEVHLTGQINTESAVAFSNACRKVRSGQTIVVNVNCRGGDASGARSMHAALRMLDTANRVFVFVTGECSSAANSVIMAVPADRRIAAAQAEFVVHATSGGSPADRAHVEEGFVVGLLMAGTRIERDSLEGLLASRADLILTAQQALELGLVSQVLA